MSLLLNRGTVPENLRVKSVGSGIAAQVYGGEGVHIGKYCLSMEDFCAMALYVLTNTNLVGEDDPRTKLLNEVKGARTVEGYSNLTAEESGEPRRLTIPGFDCRTEDERNLPERDSLVDAIYSGKT